MSTSSVASLQVLLTDYLALSKEAGRRHSDVRDVRPPQLPPLNPANSARFQAADKAYNLIKNSRDQALLNLRAGELRFELSHLGLLPLTWALQRRTSAFSSAALPAYLPCFSYAKCQSHRAGRVELAALDRGRRSS